MFSLQKKNKRVISMATHATRPPGSVKHDLPVDSYIVMLLKESVRPLNQNLIVKALKDDKVDLCCYIKQLLGELQLIGVIHLRDDGDYILTPEMRDFIEELKNDRNR